MSCEMKLDLGRRGFIRGAVATSATLMAARRGLASLFNLERHFEPVKVARNRLIREVVGLRPYRSTGFRVEATRLGNKLLIHNYGHGGAGVTLSWGTASLAVDLLRDFLQTRTRSARSSQKPKRFAIIGCGVNGLSTARLLQR